MEYGTKVACIENVKQALAMPLADIPHRREPNAILMCDPSYFEVKDCKNPFMTSNLGCVDTSEARKQWQRLKETFENLGYPVRVIAAEPDIEDMVFAANQVVPGLDENDKPFVLLAEMVHASRQREIPFYAKWFKELGYELRYLTAEPNPPRYEGQGDAIWHPSRRLLWAGCGFRTEKAAHELIAKVLRVPVISLRLANPLHYHLDTAFCVLDEHSVMYYPPAFDESGNALIKHYFRNIIEVPEADAKNFACNALALGKNVVIQRGSASTCEQLRALGFAPVEVDTSEFMKSGGSVFCLKVMFYLGNPT
jgi:N-dimethylarginine dimethylaminohydrolase